ncbi:fungal-specific transcription factor domain-containing protein [Xylariaceae sp. FL0594]|nr:fungal-specific transcription factor domain-containing protein [Xylariaceae sp. FL0594]
MGVNVEKGPMSRSCFLVHALWGNVDPKLSAIANRIKGLLHEAYGGREGHEGHEGHDENMAGSSVKQAAEDMDVDISNQENVSHRAGTSRRSSKQNIRHRASIACFSCRDRRIRCVVPKGGSGCTQCKRSGTECVIKMDDERRRPISKVYVSSLSARIDMLEGMLRDKGVVVPPATHPPMTKHEAQSSSSGDERRTSPANSRRLSNSDNHASVHHLLSPPHSHDDFGIVESSAEDSANQDGTHPGAEKLQKKGLSSIHNLRLDHKEEDYIYRLFAPKGGLCFDHLTDKVRYFGSTANSHVHADSPDKYDSRESPELVRRAERIIRSLAPKTYDYLMQNFWSYHNSVLQVVDQNAFEADRGSKKPIYYSSFLHLAILAIGWRFADKDRPDVARLDLGNRESTLHREARCMLDTELERPMGITSVQSLLLLGDLECGVGRDNTGWMYAGMANRLAFDIGLHVDCSDSGLSDGERSIRARVWRACILYDRYWALFLGRPTSIKRRDVGLNFLSKRCSSANHPLELDLSPPTSPQGREEEIHEQLLELLDLSAEIVETQNDVRPGVDTTEESGNSAYMRVLTIDQQLRAWYARLPAHLTWKVVNTRAAPLSYFLLHQQYNAAMILLHRSWEYDRWRSPEAESSNAEKGSEMRHLFVADEISDPNDPKSPALDSRTPLARSVCTQAAIQFAQVLSQSKQRYSTEKMGFTSLHPAGATSTALLAAIAYSKDETDRRSYLSYLGVVTDAIRSMSLSLQPAMRMGTLVQVVLSRLHLQTREGQDARRDLLDQTTNAVKNVQPWQGKGTGRSNLLPVRRGPSDRDQLLGNSNKRPRTTSFHQDNNRPPLPFNMPSSPSIVQQHPAPMLPYHRHSHSVPGLFPPFFDAPSGVFDLDSLRTMAMGGGDPGSYEYRGFSPLGVSDNYLRVAPSAGGWGLHSLHVAARPLEQDPVAPPNFDSHILDWVGGGGSGDGSTAMGTKGAAAAAPPMNSSSSPPMLHNHSHSSLENEGLAICKTEEAGGNLAWMGSEIEFDPLTPVSLGCSSHSHHMGVGVGVGVGGLAGDKNDGSSSSSSSSSMAPPRNHELDYLSF